ncbi:LacI family DNA-binding transcriptional regulator [Streptomyces sp. bgisy091]|uniref:LacI family DNA-binding transcriptional regulator n=1 Tax=Streptomyces sp. bgisy091 TaxID=3413778 RepID=UPI003D7412F7
MAKPSSRQDQILAALRTRGSARVAELADEFGVSHVTMRRDVEALARDERVVRSHGLVRLRSASRRTAIAPHTGTVVMVAPGRSSYFAEIVQGAQSAAAAYGLSWEFLACEEQGSAAEARDRALGTPGLVGTLLAPRWRLPVDPDAEDAAWSERTPEGPPSVLVERFASRGSTLASLDAVRTDHTHGVLLALRHLHSLGHRRILLAARDDSPTARTIRSTFVALLAEMGLPLVADPVLSSAGAGRTPDIPVPHLPDIVRSSQATAVLAHSDVDAVNLVQQLYSSGLRVPTDMSVVAYDDVIAGVGGLELTAVAPPKRDIGRSAMALLQDRIALDGPIQHVELLPELRERGSTQAI